MVPKKRIPTNLSGKRTLKPNPTFVRFDGRNNNNRRQTIHNNNRTMEEEVVTTSTDWIDLGDRSHPNLELVDKLKRELTYDGLENDLRELEQAHFEGFPEFHVILNRVKGLEKMNRGDRSHPNLVRLDELMKNLTYDGWREIFKKQKRSTKV